MSRRKVYKTDGIGVSVDEAERFPLFADQIRGEQDGKEADWPMKGETPPPVKEAREGDIIEYQDGRWSVAPLEGAVVMTAIGADGKSLSGPDNLVVFKSYEEFEQATGYKPIAPRPAEKRYVQRINDLRDFIGGVTNGRIDLFTPSIVNDVIAKLDGLQEKFLNTPSEQEFADLRQHFELIHKTMNSLASELDFIRRGHEKATPWIAEETRSRLDALLNAPDGQPENP